MKLILTIILSLFLISCQGQIQTKSITYPVDKMVVYPNMQDTASRLYPAQGRVVLTVKGNTLYYVELINSSNVPEKLNVIGPSRKINDEGGVLILYPVSSEENETVTFSILVQDGRVVSFGINDLRRMMVLIVEKPVRL